MKEKVAIAIILIISLVVRLHRINEPLADWHSWRQVDTSAVTRRFVADGIDILHPRFADLSSIPSGLDNPEGWRFVEVPFINALTASFYKTFPSISLEVWGRLTSIIFSLGSVVLIFLILNQLVDSKTGLLAALIFGLLPFNIYYHRTVLPEVPLLFFTLLSFSGFLVWLKNQKLSYYLLSLVSFSAGLLLKPYILFMGLPMFYLAWKTWGRQVFKQKLLWFYAIVSITPFISWRIWAINYKAGIPDYKWLFNSTRIRFRPAFFRWIFAERFGKLIFGYWGLIPFALGVIAKPIKKAGWLFHWWLVAMLVYLFVFATGNVTHDYYQIFIIPPLVIFTALGVISLVSQNQKTNKTISTVLAAVSMLFGLAFSWFHIRDFFNINHPEIVAAGKTVNELLPKEAKVIAPYNGDTMFLYYTGRQGWPIGGDIKRKIDLGATEYVTVNLDDEANYLIARCKPAITVDDVTVISLRNCRL